MDFWAIFRSDSEKPVIFMLERPTLNIGQMMEELNNLNPAISYRAEPRTFEEVEDQKAGH